MRVQSIVWVIESVLTLTSWQFFRFAFITFDFVLFALLPLIDVDQTCRIRIRLSHGTIARVLRSTRFAARKNLRKICRERGESDEGHTHSIDFLRMPCGCHLIDDRSLPYCWALANSVSAPTLVHSERCYLWLLHLSDRHHFQFPHRPPISVAQQQPHLCSPFNSVCAQIRSKNAIFFSFVRNYSPLLKRTSQLIGAVFHCQWIKFIYKNNEWQWEGRKKCIIMNRSNFVKVMMGLWRFDVSISLYASDLTVRLVISCSVRSKRVFESEQIFVLFHFIRSEQ